MNFLTEQEVETLVLALADGQESFTEAEAATVIEWANLARLNNAVLEKLLQRRLTVAIENGEPVFRQAAPSRGGGSNTRQGWSKKLCALRVIAQIN